MTNAASRHNSICSGSLLSMRSFAIEEAPSLLPALYATLGITTVSEKNVHRARQGVWKWVVRLTPNCYFFSAGLWAHTIFPLKRGKYMIFIFIVLHWQRYVINVQIKAKMEHTDINNLLLQYSLVIQQFIWNFSRQIQFY